jgi:hypothetical protein
MEKGIEHGCWNGRWKNRQNPRNQTWLHEEVPFAPCTFWAYCCVRFQNRLCPSATSLGHNRQGDQADHISG